MTDDASSRDPEARAPVPRNVGRFEIQSLLGEGGMARVYRAFDPSLDRPVALKMLHGASSADEEEAAKQRRRILREARAAAALSHPNAVTIYEVGEADGQAYIAMELLDGMPLRRAAPDASLAVRLAWLRDAARVLKAAHDRGLVHRVVKPDNMIVDGEGKLRLLDFGIAKRDFGTAEAELAALGIFPPEGPSSLRTAAGKQVGTPRYMAPEQKAGEPTDGRTDQYAWGLVACELLTGSVPASREDARARLGEARIDDALVTAIDKTLSPAIDERHGSLAPIATLLERLASDASSVQPAALATSASPPAPPGRSSRRTRYAAIGVALSLVAVSAVALRARLKPQEGTTSKPGTASLRCSVTSTASWPDFHPYGVFSLIGGRIAGPVKGPNQRWRLELREAAPGSDGGARADLFEGRDAPRFARVGVDGAGKPLVVGVTGEFDLEEPPYTIVLWSLPLERRRPPSFRVDGSINGLSIAPMKGATLLAVTTSFMEGRTGVQPLKYGVGLIRVDGAPADLKIQYRYENAQPMDQPSLAVTEDRAAMAFRGNAGIMAVLLDGELRGMGAPLPVTQGLVSGPAATFASGSLIVVWVAKDGGVAHLYTSTLAPGQAAFSKPALLTDDVVSEDTPMFVPLARGGSLLAWLRTDARGLTVRAARFLDGMAAPIDVMTVTRATRVSVSASGDGGDLVWVANESVGVQSAHVSCAAR